MMKSPEEHDPIWNLLLKSKRQQPSAFFVRNVVREARKLGSESQQGGWTVFIARFKRPWLAVPLATGAVALLITALTYVQTLSPPSSNVDVAMVETVKTVKTVDGQASIAPLESPASEATASTDDSANTITEDVERIGYLGELVAVSDPGDLDDAALADLLALR
jgi:hypothetical protein